MTSRRSIASLLFAIAFAGCSEPQDDPVEPPWIESFVASSIDLPSSGGDVRLTWVEHGGAEVSIAPGVGSVVGLGETTVQVTETTTFTLTSSNEVGTDEASVTIVVRPPDEPDGPDAPPTISAFVADTTELAAGGGPVTLSWAVDGATTLTIDEAVGDVTGATEVEVDVSETTTFTLSATNALGTVTATCTVTVAVPEYPPSILAFASDDTSLPQGGGWVRLSWDTSGATTLSINNGVGDVRGRTWVDVRVLVTTSFRLTARNVRGSAESTVLVEVEPSPPPTINSFSATPSTLTAPGYVTLSWTATGADTLSINQGLGDVTWEFGSTQTWVAQTTTYTLTARNAAGQVAQWSTTVVVQ